MSAPPSRSRWSRSPRGAASSPLRWPADSRRRGSCRTAGRGRGGGSRRRTDSSPWSGRGASRRRGGGPRSASSWPAILSSAGGNKCDALPSTSAARLLILMPSPVSDVALKQSAVGLHDPVLEPWLGAADEEGRQRALADLLLRAQPVIDGVSLRGIVASLSADDRDDLAATVRLRLLRKLRTMLQFDEDGVIERFRDYVATL